MILVYSFLYFFLSVYKQYFLKFLHELYEEGTVSLFLMIGSFLLFSP